MKRILAHLLAGSSLFTGVSAHAEFIRWLDAASLPGANHVFVDHPTLGRVLVTTTLPPSATFDGQPGSLGNRWWSYFEYINYYSSLAVVEATLEFEFLDGPINTQLTPIYFSANGLAAGSFYVVDNDPEYLGDIGNADGTGIHSAVGENSLKVSGVGFNHNADLFTLRAASISSVQISVYQVAGDGAGLAIGALAQPTRPRINAFNDGSTTGEAELEFVGDAMTIYVITRDQDVDFGDAMLVFPSGATVGTLNMERVTTDQNGLATVQFDLGTQPQQFIRVEIP